jgi:hypothetical protein
MFLILSMLLLSMLILSMLILSMLILNREQFWILYVESIAGLVDTMDHIGDCVEGRAIASHFKVVLRLPHNFSLTNWVVYHIQCSPQRERRGGPVRCLVLQDV